VVAIPVLKNCACRKKHIIAVVNFAADMIIGGATILESLNIYYAAGAKWTPEATRSFAFLGLSLALSFCSLLWNLEVSFVITGIHRMASAARRSAGSVTALVQKMV
jgi:hypothetical protein